MIDVKRSIRVFVDFDGTVTHKDVGYGIFTRFIKPEMIESGWHRGILDEWKAGMLSSRDCLTMECENAHTTPETFHEELDTYALTPGFVETAQFCRENGVPLMILSDGLDYYIEYLLGKYGLSDIPYRANHMEFNDGVLKASFPHEAHGCGRCGNCKRYHIDTIGSEGEHLVYVGDGYSDRYAVKRVNTVFARRDLADYCDRENLPYHPFDTFYDVLEYLQNGHDNA